MREKSVQKFAYRKKIPFLFLCTINVYAKVSKQARKL